LGDDRFLIPDWNKPHNTAAWGGEWNSKFKFENFYHLSAV